MGEEKPQQTTREIMDKLYAMAPEEVNQFLADNFRRMCSKPVSYSDSTRRDRDV